MTGFLDAPAPRWFTIPAHRPFLADLAAGVRRTLATSDGPEALAEATILVPTRRAARALAQAFLDDAPGSAVLLPQIRALGDLEEGEAPFEPGDIAVDLPPAIGGWRRRFELAGLVSRHQDLLERDLDAAAALEMADALARFLDACRLEEVGDPAAVEALVEGELARHWRISAQFLNLALEAWPRRLRELGMIDVSERQVALLRRLATRWRDHPPPEVLVAAGSTGTAPAAADLLAAIAAAPRGCLVLPGLDQSLAQDAWDEVSDPHPQGSMKRLLARAGLTRQAVRPWDAMAEVSSRGRWRRRLINEALRPPNATADWLAQIQTLRAERDPAGADPIAEGLVGLAAITAAGEEEAAAVIAVLLRETLQTPGATAALVTPDANLARRVSARLRRWNLEADSSVGAPLARAPVAVLAGLVARLAADPLDPVALLAILKHPLTRLGLDGASLAHARGQIERCGLRGARSGDWEAIELRLRAGVPPADPDRATTLLFRLRQALSLSQAPFLDGAAPAPEAAGGLTRALEALAAGPDGGPGDLWGGSAGEILAGLLAALLGQGEALPAVTPLGFSEFLGALMAGARIRPAGPAHPRLRILGVLEARLIGADRLVLAGLEEGVWPAPAPIDPFLSRPMRQALGLPPPERRIGLSAHDFAQAAAAPEVILVDRERLGGAPAVASRWLWRLRTLVAGGGLTLPGRPDLLSWARGLDSPLADPPPPLKTAVRPAPAPPLAVRPRLVPVTAVERWLRDPYGFYAQRILKLRPLDRPDELVEGRARGSAVHRALQRFVEAHPDDLPADAEARFLDLLVEALVEAGMTEGRMTRERALGARLATWVIDLERRRRPGARLLVETQGRLSFPAVGGDFTLTAKADRLEARAAAVDILDFKTGAAPSAKQVTTGLAPQLTLTGAILAGGGFADLGPAEPGEYVYVQVSGGRVPGTEVVRGTGPDLAAEAIANLKRRVALFDDPSTPYRSWAAPQFIRQAGGDYDHLARLWEWYVIGEPEAEAGAD